MSNQDNRLQALLEKYFQGQNIPEEIRELAQLSAKLDDEAIAALLQRTWETQPGLENQVFTPDETEEMLRQILNNRGRPVRVLPLVRRTWFRLAAAGLVLIAFTGIYLFMNRPAATRQLVIEPGKHIIDINPGGNKAVLTLSDGSTILLDSVPAGVITQQGAAQIRKLGDGQLAYSAAGKPGAVLYNTISTPRGGQYQLTLADGSRVWLNSASSIRFPATFVEKSRYVAISGEVYFEVAKNASQPFRVNVANRCEVEVLGTAFNVNAYNDEATLNTTLLEGRVKIMAAGGQTAILNPGQQARLSERFRILDDIDTEETAAWMTGWFIFNRTDLQSIMRQISRWYDVDILFEGNVPDRSFSGIVSRSNKVSEVLKIMENAGVRFRIESDKIVVIP